MNKCSAIKDWHFRNRFTDCSAINVEPIPNRYLMKSPRKCEWKMKNFLQEKKCFVCLLVFHLNLVILPQLIPDEIQSIWDGKRETGKSSVYLKKKKEATTPTKRKRETAFTNFTGQWCWRTWWIFPYRTDQTNSTGSCRTKNYTVRVFHPKKWKKKFKSKMAKSHIRCISYWYVCSCIQKYKNSFKIGISNTFFPFLRFRHLCLISSEFLSFIRIVR